MELLIILLLVMFVIGFIKKTIKFAFSLGLICVLFAAANSFFNIL